jgi:hypothetical protein
MTQEEFSLYLSKFSNSESNPFAEQEGFYYVKPNSEYIKRRQEKEQVSRKMWRMVGLMTHVIKRFPYVRCILVTGSLSKNNSDRSSDLDFMIITQKNRLWVARMLHMLFKKIFLFNSYKYFCLNYYITEDNLEIDEKNIFTATEVAYVKATYNTKLMEDFLKANMWVKQYFPNYVLSDPRYNAPLCKVTNSQSRIQRFFEMLLNGKLGDRLNEKFRQMTIKHWYHRFGHIDKKDHAVMFKSTDKVSKAHPHNMQKKILNRYNDKLKEFNL